MDNQQVTRSRDIQPGRQVAGQRSPVRLCSSEPGRIESDMSDKVWPNMAENEPRLCSSGACRHDHGRPETDKLTGRTTAACGSWVWIVDATGVGACGDLPSARPGLTATPRPGQGRALPRWPWRGRHESDSSQATRRFSAGVGRGAGRGTLSTLRYFVTASPRCPRTSRRHPTDR